jgi:hypothetical protein
VAAGPCLPLGGALTYSHLVKALHAEALLTWVYAAGFGGSTIPVALYLHRFGRLPSFFGLFEMYGGPWWPRYGRPAFTWLLVAFFFVAVLPAYAAVLLWNASERGGWLTLIILPVEAVFWFGFDLPIPKALGLARIALLALGWSFLT